jgi:hypothetical protein
MRTGYHLGAVAAAALIFGLGADLSGADAHARSGSHKHARMERHAAKAQPTKVATVKAATAKAATKPSADHPRVAERFAALQMPQPDLGAASQANEEERRARLRQALEVRAQEIAVAHLETTGSLAAPGTPASGPAARPTDTQPRSVSFDFESGLKTTTFPGDRIVREGFDVTAGKALASTPPGEASLLRPRP